MRDPQMPDPMTISDLKDEMRGIFRRTWTQEIEDSKPDQNVTSEEIIRWTSLAAFKMGEAIKALVAEEIAKQKAESY